MSGLTRPPHRLSPDWAEAAPFANDNFDKIVQSVNDIGAKFTNLASVTVTINPGDAHRVLVDVTDERAQYTYGLTQVVPRVDAYIAFDNDQNYRLGVGASLSAGQELITMSTYVYSTPRNITDEVATYVIELFNHDVAGHTVYIHTDNSYMDSPQDGIFR